MTARRQLPLTARLAILTCCVLIGCRQSDSGLPLDASAELADELSFADGTWHREAEMAPEQEELLVNWFQQHPDVVGSAEFEGTPTVYHDGGKGVLFVWTYTSVEGGGWTRLLYQRGSFELESGSGAPFGE